MRREKIGWFTSLSIVQALEYQDLHIDREAQVALFLYACLFPLQSQATEFQEETLDVMH